MLLGESAEQLTVQRQRIENFLRERLQLALHPNKTILQRWLDNHQALLAPGVPSPALLQRMASTLNSYYGVFSHSDTYKLRKHIYQKELGPLKRFFWPAGPNYPHLRVKKVWLIGQIP